MFNKDLIVAILDKKGWSRYKLCKEANLAQSTLSDILNGINVNPRMDTIQKIASALEVDVNSFFDENFPADKEDIERWDRQYSSIHKESDTDLKRIERARLKMEPKDKEKMMKILEASFEDYFND